MAVSPAAGIQKRRFLPPRKPATRFYRRAAVLFARLPNLSVAIVLSLPLLFCATVSAQHEQLQSNAAPATTSVGLANVPAVPAQVTGDPVAMASLGPADARVAILEFSDFQCPFCARMAVLLRKFQQEHPGEIRFVFKHNPLPMHADSALAHEAALAAGEQGKFWEMHDLLFANQTHLKREDLLRYAQELQLGMAQFERALEAHAFQSTVDEDRAEARALGVSATPTFFINGRKNVGAISEESLQEIVNEASGIAKPAALPEKAVSKTNGLSDAALKSSPTRGPAAAPVTIVEFSDFQCPYCARAVPTMQGVLDRYPQGVKWVFRNFPLNFHPDSALAHQAAFAANAQGKFWEMHDRIFANQRAMKRDDLLRIARELRLDMEKFTADLDSGRFKAAIDADVAEGQRLGVTGTPTFFIDGKEVLGAQSATFRSAIDAALLAKGIQPPKEPSPKALAPEDTEMAKGPRNAPVQVLWYSDLESPLAPQAAKLISDVMASYPEKIRVVFKNRPLEFHQHALLAHQAAAAAAAQGKFWPMHDLILANQQNLTRENLLNLAARLGLDQEKFAAALDQGSHRFSIEQELTEAKTRKVFGVPVFFVNGERVDGVEPLEQFKKVIDAQLNGATSARK